MRKLSTLFICLLLIGGLASINSCKKDEKTKGCMDKDSKNYDPKAEIDDGNCQFEGSLVFWYNKATADSLADYAVTSLKYYVGDKLIGSNSADVYYTAEPTCSQNGTITVTKDLGKDKKKSFSFKVVDDTGETIWEGNTDFDANTCTAFELTW